MPKETRGGSGIKDRNISSTAGIKMTKLDDVSFSEDFSVYGAAPKGFQNLGLGGVDAADTDGLHHHCYVGSGRKFTYVNIGTQTLAPAMTATGLNISADQTDNEGIEIFSHSVGATGRPFEVGRDPDFYFRLKFNIADVSGTDDFHVGFRMAEAHEAAVDSYENRCGLGIITAANPAAIYVVSELTAGAGTEVETDTTDTLADGVTTTWEIRIDDAGRATYLIDGAAPSTTAAVTMGDGVLMIPFVSFIHANAAQAGAINLITWEVGYL